jgi:uncharacterized protein (TIGR02271 family)
MLTENQARETIGATAYSVDGDKLGKVGQLFLDDQTGRPEFVTVNTGLFGTKETYIPIADATFNGDRLTVPFGKDQVKGAPNVDAEGGHLDPAEEQRLYEHYSLHYDQSGVSGHDTDRDGIQSGTAGAAGNLGTGTTGRSTDNDVTADSTLRGNAGTGTGTDSSTSRLTDDVRGTEGHDTSGPTTDDAMTRSEEHLQVGTTTQEVGRARLRKYVTTEDQTVTVPVRKEKAVLEREPITDANIGDATAGPDLSDEEHEVTLSEERVVVDKETQPVERVRLGTETVTDQETVTEEVRKEHIETEGDVDKRV